jgi:tetratricopeptide (TPR) repeat protein
VPFPPVTAFFLCVAFAACATTGGNDPDALSSNKPVSRSSNYGVTENIQPQTAGAFMDRGMLFAFRGDYDLVIEDYTQAVKLDPNDAFAYNNRGIAYSNKKKILSGE